MMRPIVACLAAAVGAAVLAAPSLARQPAADRFVAKPGVKPESCIPIRSIRESRVRDDQTIDFYMNGGRILRSRLPFRCPQLGFERSFSYSTSLSQLCSTDIITVLYTPGIQRGASCGLGEFVEVEERKDGEVADERDAGDAPPK